MNKRNFLISLLALGLVFQLSAQSEIQKDKKEQVVVESENVEPSSSEILTEEQLERKKAKKEGQSNSRSFAPEDIGLFSNQGVSVISGGEGKLVLENGSEQLRMDDEDIQVYNSEAGTFTGTLYINDQGGDVDISSGNLTVPELGPIGLNGDANVDGNLDVTGIMEVDGHVGIGVPQDIFIPLNVSTSFSVMTKLNSTATSALLEIHKNNVRKGTIWNKNDDILLTSDDGLVQLAINSNEEQLTVEPNGGVIIGPYIAPPQNYQLVVRHENGYGLDIENVGTGNDWELFTSAAVTDAPLNLYYNNSYKGQFSAIDGVYTTSDRSLKRNITHLGTVLPKLMQLEVSKYNYNDSSKNCIGFIAQDVKKYFPEMVNVSQDERSMGIHSLNYANMSSIAIKAIQEQQVVITDQESEINELKRQVEHLMQRVEALEGK